MSGSCEVVGRGEARVRWIEPGPAAERIERNREAIDAVWAGELERGLDLHDGTLLSPVNVAARDDAVLLEGELVSYRAFIAGRRLPELGLGLGSIAVNGATIAGDRVLVARRSDRSSSHAGLVELLPAGTLGREVARPDGSVDHRAALVTELEEELGVRAPRVTRIDPLCVIHDAEAAVFDVCSAVHLEPGADEALLAGVEAGTEHSDPRLIPLAQLAGTAAREGDGWTPTSLALAGELVRGRA